MRYCIECSKEIIGDIRKGLCYSCYSRHYRRTHKNAYNKWTIQLAREIHLLLDLPLGSHEAFGRKVIETVITTIKNALLRGEKVNITGFGKFTIRTRRSCNATNRIIKSGHQPFYYSPVKIRTQPKRYVHFSPSLPLKAMLHLDDPNKKLKQIIQSWSKS